MKDMTSLQTRYMPINGRMTAKKVCVYVCLALHPSETPLDHPSRRLGYVSPAPQAILKDLVTIHSRGSTWVYLFRGPPVPS